jgi:hypothetical protein
MPTIVIGDKRITVGDEFLSMSEADQHKTIDEIAAKLKITPSAPKAPANETPAASEGMPAPRGPLDKAWSAMTGGRNLNADLYAAREAVRTPSFEDIGGNIAREAQTAAQFAKEGGESAVENFKAGRPLSAVLGAGQQLAGGAGIVLSPLSGLVRSYVTDPVSRFLGPEVGEKAGMVANIVATPGGLTKAARPVEVLANTGGRGVTAIENMVRPDLNALVKATGNKAPDVVNALREATSGVESAGQAAAPAGSAGFSKFTSELAGHAPETVADAQKVQDALLTARANVAEGRMAEGTRALADTVAEPNVQTVGQRLITTAEKIKEDVKRTLIRPKFKEAENLAGNAPIDISPLTNEAANIIDTIDPDAAAVLSRRLGKFKGETTTPELFGPGGAPYKGTPVVTPPTATLSDVGDIRSAINNAAVKAKAAGDDAGYTRLMKLHKRLDDAVISSDTLPPKALAAYKDALETYATQYAPRFKEGLQVNLFKIKNGEHGIGASNVVDRFFNDADKTDNFIALFGKNPSAMKDAQLGIEGLFRNQVIKDGVIDTKAYEKFLKDYGPQIDKLDANGLNLRAKFDTLAQETDRITSPKAAIAETRKGVEFEQPPKGVAKTATDERVAALVSNTSPEDLSSLRDAVEVVRRGQENTRLAGIANAEKSGLPIVPSTTPSFLNTKLRIITEVYRRIAGRLDTKMAKKLGEMLHDPTRLNEAADLLDAAIARKRAQEARIVTGTTAPPYSGALLGSVNALAPSQQNQNALAR